MPLCHGVTAHATLKETEGARMRERGSDSIPLCSQDIQDMLESEVFTELDFFFFFRQWN